jgi:hypothetical protein
MSSGAAVVAADKFGAAEIVDPRPYFVGELAATLAKYPHIGKVVPAMGYSEQQVRGVGVQYGVAEKLCCCAMKFKLLAAQTPAVPCSCPQ